MSRPLTPVQQWRQSLETARDALLKAAAATVSVLENPTDTSALAFAVLEAAIGLQQLAKADTNERALAVVEQVLQNARNDHAC